MSDAGAGAAAAGRACYVYELPYETHRALCRLLDTQDEWRELAGRHMSYSPFDVHGFTNTARQSCTSPTKLLLEDWGQQNHNTNELFVLLYKMGHFTAMQCIKDCVDAKYLKLMKKRPKLDESIKKKEPTDTTVGSIPVPVREIGKDEGQGVKRRPATSEQRPLETITDNESTATSDNNPVVLRSEVRRAVTSIPLIPFRELTEATNNWNPENLLGKGGFGEVYKGEWKQTRVAIKRLKQESNETHEDATTQEFIRELCLNGYRHDNLLPLYGYSMGGPGPCLVYQLMMGGSLEQRLRCKNGIAPLTWQQRQNIAQGIARGIQFLHCRDAPLIHGDIKPANILLDPCTEPKIGDFGLARKGPFGLDRKHVMVSKVQGTRYYLPDDYITSKLLSPAVDVFSFGLVMFEIASGARVYDKQRGEGAWLKDHVNQITASKMDLAILEDPLLRNSQFSSPNLCRQFIQIGVHCTKAGAADRPSMLQVYQVLNR